MALALICTVLAYTIITIIAMIIVAFIGDLLRLLARDPVGDVITVIFIICSGLLYIILSFRWMDLLYALFL
ncbi:hypothetical protein LCGC14_2295650 [marine sediment metagenome]|uniref:Uncharacterized protein n=1 Tax=marine sediment metagenome TaxID=412755 RepID=A0A0F9CQG9_9ZZZZ